MADGRIRVERPKFGSGLAEIAELAVANAWAHSPEK